MLALHKFLMASYAYYILDKSIMSDAEYDSTAKELLEKWDTFEHQHKYLIDKGALEAGTAYMISEDKYPPIVKNATLLYIKEKNIS
jgi:NAD-dependent DNA ligase